MLSPDYLEHVPDRLVELYAQAETDIIADMARKINAYDYFSSASEWQAVKVHEMGLTYEEIQKKLSSLSGRTLSELKKLLEEAGVKTLSADDAIYRKAGLLPQPLKESKHLIAILNESLKKTNNTFKNLTSTTAKEASGQFVEALDRAYMQIVSGGIDKNAAVRLAIQHLTENGLRSIKYPTRTDHLDVAVRRAVRTGVNQTAGRLQEARAEEMGCDLVETTAHDGARPSHETWQGKVFSRSGSSKKYPAFKESTGYGTVTGLMGANCRHSFYPFFEDSEPIYTKSELAELNQPKYHYRGKDITEYEAVQRQRYHERQIRRWKREKEAMKAAGQPTDRAEARLRKWNRIQDDFLEQTGLKRQVDLEQIAKKVDKKTKLADFKFKIVKRGKDTFQDQRTVLEVAAETPEKVMDAMKSTTVKVGGYGGSAYDYNYDVMYVADGASATEIHHEIGHMIDAKLADKKEVDQLKKGIFSEAKYSDIIIKTMHQTNGDPVDVFLVKSDALLSEYQGRIYVENPTEAFDENGYLKTDLLLEFVSEIYREYMENPEKLKESHVKFYDFIERTVKDGLER